VRYRPQPPPAPPHEGGPEPAPIRLSDEPAAKLDSTLSVAELPHDGHSGSGAFESMLRRRAKM
jgi:hypothetical protein